MPDEPPPHHRKLLRLAGYDYSSEGSYLITIVTYNRIPVFGRILDNELVLSKAGQIARSEWFRTQHLRENVGLFEDEFVVMPNHIHGVIWLRDESVGVERRSRHTKSNHPLVSPGSIPAIIRAYKSAVTYTINSLQNTKGRAVWQRNYYEHIIRDEKDYENIVEYIYQNPYNWEKDEENKL